MCPNTRATHLNWFLLFFSGTHCKKIFSLTKTFSFAKNLLQKHFPDTKNVSVDYKMQGVSIPSWHLGPDPVNSSTMAVVNFLSNAKIFKVRSEWPIETGCPPDNSIAWQLSYLSLPYLTLPYLTLPYLTLPYLTLPYLTFPYLTLPYLTLPHVTVLYLTLHFSPLLHTLASSVIP